MALIDRLRRHLPRLSVAQAARLFEMAARRRARPSELGADLVAAEEPLRLVASDRMAMPLGEVAAIEPDGPRPRLVATVLGLGGASAALPAFYSELQLRRRRLRDRALADFLGLFDHRALSFFWRITAKYHWPTALERAGGRDPASLALVGLAGLATPGTQQRLPVDDLALAPLAHHLSGQRRSAASLALVLRHMLGLDVRIVEAQPVWLPLPADEQTRLGRPGQNARLGGDGSDGGDAGLGTLDSAVVGAAILDVQYHFVIAIGPLDWDGLMRFCASDGPRLRLESVCRLHVGLAHRPLLRLSVPGPAVRPARLGDIAAPALLGRTCWLGDAGPGLREDCVLPLGG